MLPWIIMERQASPTPKDPKRYPMLRNLQFSPIRENEEQYIVLWDPTGLSRDKLILPLSYFFVVQHFDGEHSLEEIGMLYLKRFGEFLNPLNLERLVEDLDAKLFLEGERVEAAKEQARKTYRDSPVRKAAFAGRSYEADGQRLRAQIEGFFSSKEGPDPKPSENRGKKIKGLVAPTYDLREAGPIYAWAYKELQEAEAPDLFVLLGTAYSGMESPYAVTDKAFETPLGIVRADHFILDRLRATVPQCFDDELYHQHEHAIEFQLPFLQHIVGGKKPMSIVPVLCSFPTASLVDPQSREWIESFIAALKEAIAMSGRDFCAIAGAELAHIGLRYGDSSPPTDFSFHRCMRQDLAMLKHVEDLDPEAFAQFIRKENDQRRVSGFSAIYTLLRLIQADKGRVLRYDRGITDQYNSTVTYAAMAFF